MGAEGIEFSCNNLIAAPCLDATAGKYEYREEVCHGCDHIERWYRDPIQVIQNVMSICKESQNNGSSANIG